MPVKNGCWKVTVFAEVPDAIRPFVASEFPTLVSVLCFKLASKPSSVTLIFCAGSFDTNTHLNLNPLAVYSPFAKSLNWLKLAPIVQLLPSPIVLDVEERTLKLFASIIDTIS